MKKLYSTLFILVCFVGLSFAQNYDFGVIALDVPAPGANVDPSASDSMKITVENFGPALPTTDSITLVMLVDGIPTGFIYWVKFTGPFPTGATTQLGWDIDFGTLNIGTRSICWSIAMLNDTNSLNDSICANYNIMPTGIESMLGQGSNIFLSNGQLNVDVTNADIQGSSMLSVYNMAGKLIYSEESVGNGQVTSIINMSDQANGVYIVRLMSDGKLIESRKLLR